MSFTPSYGKIEIEPLKKDGPILSHEDTLLEAGRIIAVGEYSAYSVGYIIYFDSWACAKTAPDSQGNVHYILPDNKDVILGYEKYAPPEQPM